MVQLSIWQEEVVWLRNEYYCEACDVEWADEWSCECDDRCPKCRREIEPFDSIEIEPSTEAKMQLAIRHAHDQMMSDRA